MHADMTTFLQFCDNCIDFWWRNESSTSWLFASSYRRKVLPCRTLRMTVSWSLDSECRHLWWACIVVCTCTKLRDRSYSLASLRVWNSLPISLWQPNIEFGQFCWLLKTFLFVWDRAALVTSPLMHRVYKSIRLVPTYLWPTSGLLWICFSTILSQCLTASILAPAVQRSASSHCLPLPRLSVMSGMSCWMQPTSTSSLSYFTE